MKNQYTREALIDNFEKDVLASGTTLEAYITCHKTIDKLKEIMSNVLLDANMEFADLQADALDGEKVVVDGKVVSSKDKPKKWKHSADYIKLKNELKAMESTERETGVAEDITKPFDPSKDVAFRLVNQK